MTETTRPPAALWAAEPPARRGRLVPLRTLRRFILATAALAVVGAFGGLLAWFRPLSPPYFVPLWVTQYRSPVFPHPAAAEADRQSVRAAGLFPRGADAYASQE